MMDFVSIRHRLHAHPGLSGDEGYAHDLIVNFLQECHPSRVWEHVGGYGVVAAWGENGSRRTLAFRADTDALPIHEGGDAEYRSVEPFVAHKCGHDGHTTILLRFAQMVDEARTSLSCNVLLIFQPEEETGFGSQKVLDAGILQQYNIQGVFGLHNLPGFALGSVVLNYHTFAAASTGVVFSLHGRQTHASTPEKGLNPGLAVSEVLREIEHLNSRKNCMFDEFQQCTLICVRLGEEAFGTSAGDAQVMFTLRTFSNDRMAKLLADANGLVEGIAARHNLGFEVELREPFRATENNSLLVEQMESAFDDCRVTTAIVPFRWSEDFANYLLHFPGAMFGIGAGEKHAELHHPDYDFPDEIIETGAGLFWKLLKAFENE